MAAQPILSLGKPGNLATATYSLSSMQSDGQRMDMEINVLALVKGEERFIFLFDDVNRDETLRQLARFAADPELDFSWYDAAMLSRKIRDAVPSEEELMGHAEFDDASMDDFR